MSARDLRAFLEPDSVAVVGAGERATSSGGAVMRNLDLAGFEGRLVPVNPKGGTMFGRAAVTSLGELGEPVDLVVVVIRPDLIPAAVEEAAATGHRNVLILPGGFAESGADGQARDRALRQLAAERGVTIGGPNCAGTMHLGTRRRFAASFLRDLPPGGPLAFVSQSGALAEEVIAAAHPRGCRGARPPVAHFRARVADPVRNVGSGDKSRPNAVAARDGRNLSGCGHIAAAIAPYPG